MPQVDNYNDTELSTARERLIGLTNRVIAGLLIHTTRMSSDSCEGSRFAKIESSCASGTSLQAYGVDPVFVLGSELFDPDLDNQASLLTFYNCSTLPSDTDLVHGLVDPYSKSGALVNEPPFCANLFNMRDVPFGFFHEPLEGKPDGFPVWFDINLSEDQAQYWHQYLVEGLMLDVLTRELTVEMVTYNAELRMFSSVFVRFRFTDGGSIRLTYKLHTIRVELYSDKRDYIRLVLEITFALLVLASAYYQLKVRRRRLGGCTREVVQRHVSQRSRRRSTQRRERAQGVFIAWRETRNPLSYFTSGWAWVGLASTALMITSIIVWWTFVLRHIPAFDINIRYDVYNDLNAQAHILQFRGAGEGLHSAVAAFSDLQFLVSTLSWYYAINGINILLVIARILSLMHFQPRLGIVTRSLLLAGPDLLHFAVVAGIVFVGYAMMAHVIFGNVIEKFSTFQLSIDTCFEMLLGEIGVNEDLKALTGLQGLAGSLFFWTFELLVFMVLLNFLLAIIVDAFSVVKENTSESTGLHEELSQMAREKWRSLLGSLLNVHYIPSKRLSTLLKLWAGSELEETRAKKPHEDAGQKRIRVRRSASRRRKSVAGRAACRRMRPIRRRSAPRRAPAARLAATLACTPLLRHLASGDTARLRALQVMDYELTEHDVQDILSEAMQAMADDGDLDDDAADEELGGRCFGRRAKAAAKANELSAPELESAARWLLDRFGHDDDSGEDEDGGGGDDDEARRPSDRADRGETERARGRSPSGAVTAPSRELTARGPRCSGSQVHRGGAGQGARRASKGARAPRAGATRARDGPARAHGRAAGARGPAGQACAVSRVTMGRRGRCGSGRGGGDGGSDRQPSGRQPPGTFATRRWRRRRGAVYQRWRPVGRAAGLCRDGAGRIVPRRCRREPDYQGNCRRGAAGADRNAAREPDSELGRADGERRRRPGSPGPEERLSPRGQARTRARELSASSSGSAREPCSGCSSMHLLVLEPQRGEQTAVHV